MTGSDSQVIERMETLIKQWEDQSDQRSLFLKCYLMMTHNMVSAIDRHEFKDSLWVDQLLSRFAGYYFIALDAYERDPSTSPPIWQLAHNSTQSVDTMAIQVLMLGVNAHINYDLVKTLVELLQPEWAGLSEIQRAERYADHSYVNEVIANTIDAVQDTILEPAMPSMDIVDKAMGPFDELLLSRLLSHWRDRVWYYVTLLLETEEEEERVRLIQQVEKNAMQQADAILGKDWRTAFEDLL